MSRLAGVAYLGIKVDARCRLASAVDAVDALLMDAAIQNCVGGPERMEHFSRKPVDQKSAGISITQGNRLRGNRDPRLNNYLARCHSIDSFGALGEAAACRPRSPRHWTRSVQTWPHCGCASDACEI